MDLLEVAQETDGFSGSDLKEMSRRALLCVREYVNSTSEERYVYLGVHLLIFMSDPFRAFKLLNKLGLGLLFCFIIPALFTK